MGLRVLNDSNIDKLKGFTGIEGLMTTKLIDTHRVGPDGFFNKNYSGI